MADVPSILQDKVRYGVGEISASVIFRFMTQSSVTELCKQPGRIEAASPQRSRDMW